MSSLFTRIRKQEGGFALLEQLWTSVLALVIVGVPLMLAVNSFRQEQRVQDNTTATRSLEEGVGLLMKDLRQSTAATVTASGATLTIPAAIPNRTTSATTPAPPSGVAVTWTCTAGASCTRAVSGAATETVVRNVVSATFSPQSASGATTVPQSNPPFVAVTITARPRISATELQSGTPDSATPVSLSASVALRNLS